MSDQTATAWLLEYAEGQFAAFGLQGTLSLVELPAYTVVPGAPPHCLGLMRWESHSMPLLDLRVLSGRGSPHDCAVPSHAVVLAWRDAGARQVELGAVAASMLVSMIQVTDSQRCPAPACGEGLRRVASCWFEHRGQPVAVLDTARLFGSEMAWCPEPVAEALLDH
jgi:chemotaxis signal transduction protein